MKIKNEGIRAMFDPDYHFQSGDEKKRKARIKSFSLTQAEIEVMELLRARLLKRIINISESEIIRTGIKVISQMSDEVFLEHYQSIHKVPFGRPPK